MSPDSWFHDKSICVTCSKFPTSNGRWLLKELEDIVICSMSLRLQKDEGMEVNLLESQYNFWSLERLPQHAGISPKSLLWFKNNSTKFLSWQIPSGMDPLSLLCWRNKPWRLFIPLIVVGIGPTNSLFSRLRIFKLLKLTIPIGIVPFMLQLDTTNSSREVEKFPMEVGRVPWSGLSATTILIKPQFVKDERKLNSRLEYSLAKN